LRFQKGPSYCKLLRKERLKCGISVRKLAKAVGLDHTHISKIELGKATPPAEKMAAIARFLGSEELTEAGEHALLRHLVDLNLFLQSEYAQMSEELREEIGLTEAWRHAHSVMVGKLIRTWDRRGKWRDMSLREIQKVTGMSPRKIQKLTASIAQFREHDDESSIGKPERIIDVQPLWEPVPQAKAEGEPPTPETVAADSRAEHRAQAPAASSRKNRVRSSSKAAKTEP